MADKVADAGYLRIGNEADRMTIAGILYKNGYSVCLAKSKKNAKSYEYLVKYSLIDPVAEGEGYPNEG